MFSLRNFISDMRKFKLLIVGGQPPVRRGIRNVLQALGLTNFREAEDGDDALRKLRSDTFDFAVCEWELPFMSGLDVALGIRGDERLKHIPLLLIAPEGGNPAGQYGLTSHDGFIAPPLLPQTLEDKMVELLFNNLQPTPLDRHLQSAGRLMAQARFTDAHHELDQAKALDERAPMVDYFRQLVYLAEGQPEKAEEAIASARNIFAENITSPRQAKARIEQGRQFLDQRRIGEAREAFDQALALDPDNADLPMEIGEAYLSRGFPEQAEMVFKAFIEVNPDDVILYNRLGMAFRRQRKFSEAIAYFNKALEIAPHEENLHFNLARAYLSAGNRGDAAASLRKALKVFPEFHEARELLHKISH